MHSEQIEMTREDARSAYKAYRRAVNFNQPIDREIKRAYRAIAQGKVVIKALESIQTAGVNAEGLPNLAISRADQPFVHLWKDDQQLIFSPRSAIWGRRVHKSLEHRIDKPATWPDLPKPSAGVYSWKAIVPIVPAPYRPAGALENYHILFEAIWKREVPIDPLLVRRLGEGDLWVVLAVWDLTPVEAAALKARL